MPQSKKVKRVNSSKKSSKAEEKFPVAISVRVEGADEAITKLKAIEEASKRLGDVLFNLNKQVVSLRIEFPSSHAIAKQVEQEIKEIQQV